MNNKPLVSIIIPTYNRADKISNAINSIRNQTFKDWKLIIVDDRSTDNTSSLIDKYTEIDNRIKYTVNHRKKGTAGARNCGLLQAEGRYIAFLDSDDKWEEHHLTDSISVLNKYKRTVCFALWNEIKKGVKKKVDEINHEVFKTGFEKFKHKTRGNVIIFDNKDFYPHLLAEDFFCYQINTMVFEKKILIRTGYFDEYLYANDDTDFIFRVILSEGFCLIKDYHFNYYYGDDCIYSFIDRQSTNIEEITTNPVYIKKITFHGKYKIKYLKKKILSIRKSKVINNKLKWITLSFLKISGKYFTMGVVNRNYNYLLSLYYFLLALLFRPDEELFVTILRTLWSRYYITGNMDIKSLDIT